MREDLSMTQKDKFMLQAKVSELKNNMKTLLQQNQQLKLDLRRGAAKTVSSCAIRGTGLRGAGRFSDTVICDHIQQLLCGSKWRGILLGQQATSFYFIFYSIVCFFS